MTNDRLVDYADMFAALGSEPRLRIVRLLLSAYPEGLIVGDIQAELGIANSTLSHHLEKLKTKVLLRASRQQSALVLRQRGCVGRTSEVPLRRMLHAKWSGKPEGGFTESDF